MGTWAGDDPSVALHPKGDIHVLEGIPGAHGGWVRGHVPGWMAGGRGRDTQVWWCVRRGHPGSTRGGAQGMWGTSMGTHRGGEAQEAAGTVARPGGDTQGTLVAGKATHPRGGHPGDMGDPGDVRGPMNAIATGGGGGRAGHGSTSWGGTSRGQGEQGWGHIPRGHPGDVGTQSRDITQGDAEGCTGDTS